ncbi:MAG TPA: Asp23/Gls24 family envelope stress response protein [Anaerolineae bacterium]|nr:Asp23/Gls24 family envelope stress response protein [Anaerolineae bacterium]
MDNNLRTPGKTTISPEVILTIARLTTLEIEGVSRLCQIRPRVNELFKRTQCEGVHLEIEDDRVYADIYVVLKNGVNVREVSRNIQNTVSQAILKMVGMNVGRINIHIEDIDFLNEENKEA